MPAICGRTLASKFSLGSCFLSCSTLLSHDDSSSVQHGFGSCGVLVNDSNSDSTTYGRVGFLLECPSAQSAEQLKLQPKLNFLKIGFGSSGHCHVFWNLDVDLGGHTIGRNSTQRVVHVPQSIASLVLCIPLLSHECEVPVTQITLQRYLIQKGGLSLGNPC